MFEQSGRLVLRGFGPGAAVLLLSLALPGLALETPQPETPQSEASQPETLQSSDIQPVSKDATTTDAAIADTPKTIQPLSDRCAALETPASETPAPETPTPETTPETTSQTTSEPAETEALDPKIEPKIEPEIDPEVAAKLAAKLAQEKRDICQLYKADQLYQQGQIETAIAIYQAVKPAFTTATPEATPAAKLDGALPAPVAPPPVAFSDPEQLSPSGQVYLREASAGQAQNLTTRVLVPLKLLTEAYPEYIPGHLQYAAALVAQGQAKPGLEVLNQAIKRYPNQVDLLKASIALAAQQHRWMEASMQARRFAQLNPEHPEAATFVALAQENLKRYQGEVRDRLTANTIANVLTGAVTYGVTGNLWNTLSTLQTTSLMLRGEAGVGNGISKSIQRQIPLVEAEDVVAYVNELGQKLAKVAGREEFEYEFFVILDENLNAFALPGGKVFVNAGAIAKTKSEAELAGLLSHELAHAVLSHGFQLVSNGSLLADLSRFVPYAGYAANLVVLNYSRDMEREADELGTRILSAAGYPADGLHNLMKILGEEDKSRPLLAWMSTHPETEERVGNLQRQIQAEGLMRYGVEGVERHDLMREKVRVLLEAAKQKEDEERKNRPGWR